MKQEYLSVDKSQGNKFYLKLHAQAKGAAWMRQAIGAVCGLVVGLVAFIFGSVFTVIGWIASPGSIGLFLGRYGAVMFLIGVPLLIIGAHCLDLLERKKRPSIHIALQPSDAEHNADTPSVKQTDGHLFAMIGVLAAVFFVLPATTHAQQTIFNVPNTDVLPAGKIYAELDISAKPVNPKFSAFVPRLVIGVGGNAEIGLNVTGNVQPGPDSTTLVPAVKWKVYDGKDNGWAVVIGNNFYIPVRNRSYKAGNHFYSQFSKTFKTETRLSFGGYHFTENVVAPNAQRVGGQFSFEQSITSRFGTQADWITGKHANGYFTPGVYFKLTGKLTGYAAYSIGNSNVTNGNHYFYGELGFNFH